MVLVAAVKIMLEELEIVHQYLHHKEILEEIPMSLVDQLAAAVLELLDHLLLRSVLVL